VLALDRSFAAGGAVRRYDDDGRLLARSVPISRAGISIYFGREIPGWRGLGLDGWRTYRLHRDPAELRKAASSFDGAPMLSEHCAIDGDYPRELVTGSIGDAHFDGEFLRADVCVWSADAIRGIEGGDRRELSCGYSYRPIMRPGVFRGQRFDGKMSEIKGNHVALVNVGRAGSDCAL
jgi:hypothetical protein